jgi:carbon-monoxide dehydrogenase large subunit
MSELHYVGKSVPRVDALKKVLGSAQFAADLFPRKRGMLYVKILRSPCAHARIVRCGTSIAERHPGVKLVLTGKDVPEKFTWRVPPVLARGEARWAGEGIAAVAADTPERAEEALELLEVEYEELPAVLDAEEAMKPGCRIIVDPDWGKSPGGKAKTPQLPNVTGHYKLRRGNTAEGFAGADLILENRFSTCRIHHCQLEPIACVAEPDEGGGLTLWTNGQGAYAIREEICDVLSLSPSKVRVITPYQGGSFGNRNRIFVEPLVSFIALKTGRPARVTFTREEMYLASVSRLPVVNYIKTGVRKDGVITAQEMRIILDNGATYDAIQDGRAAASAAVCVYRIPNYDLDSYGVNTHTPPSGPYRGLGSTQVAWAVESQMDLLARKLGMSPVEIRQKNILNRGEKTGFGETLESIGVLECLEAVARSMEADSPPPLKAGSCRRGKGLAIAGKQNQYLGRAEAEVLVYEDGTVEARFSSDEHGMGSETVVAQIVAEEFRTPPEAVRVLRGDTALTPFNVRSASSYTTYCTGNAMRMACRDAIRQIREAAARRFEIDPGELEVNHGKVFVRNSPMAEIRIPDLFPAPSQTVVQDHGMFRGGGKIVGKGIFAPRPNVPWDPETGQTEKMFNWYQYNAFGVEVEVDTETGQVRLLKAVGAFDMGFPINPKMCEGQIEGALGMAIGATLLEEYIYDRGRVINCSFGNYRLPTFGEVPLRGNIECLFAPDPLPDGPWGAKGIGEGAMVSIGPAIANAIHNAIGIRFKDMPLSPERILQAIQATPREARKEPL